MNNTIACFYISCCWWCLSEAANAVVTKIINSGAGDSGGSKAENNVGSNSGSNAGSNSGSNAGSNNGKG